MYVERYVERYVDETLIPNSSIKGLHILNKRISTMQTENKPH